MKPLAIILCVVALFAYAEESIAERQAWREKVRADLKAQLDAIQAENRKAMNARYNTNGTFTVEGPFTSDTLTNCVSLSLTFTKPVIMKCTNCTESARVARKNGTE